MNQPKGSPDRSGMAARAQIGVKRARRLVRKKLKISAPGRNVIVRPTDSFLTSYPRSGNTWMRFMITAFLRPGTSLSGGIVQETVPDIYAATRRELEVLADPRVLKSHEYFDPRYPRVVYLVRDPRDMAVSYFHFHQRIGVIPESLPMEDFVVELVDGRVGAYGDWEEHVQSWLATRGDRDTFILVRYEDLLHDAPTELMRVVRFLGHDPDEARVSAAVEAARFEEMKKAAPVRVPQPGRSVMARRGKEGAWKDELPESSRALIESRFGDTMRRLRYLD